jgi:hypothetical protein
MTRFALALAVFAAACATPTSRFTKSEELDAMAREVLPPPPKVLPVRDVKTWELLGTLPTRVEHAQLTTLPGPFAQLLADAAAPGRFAVSADMMCIAEQIGRFELENEGTPGTLLEKFIQARCGTPSARVIVSSVFGDAPEAHPDAELAEHWGPDINKSLAAVPPGAFAGLSLVRGHGKARITLAWARDEVQLEPVSIFPEGDVVRVRGQVLHEVDEVSGSVNQGEFDAADCVRNTDVPLPHFELACQVHAGDASAWLGVWVRDRGRFLSHPVFETLVWPTHAPTATFTRPTHAVLRDGSAAAFLEALNALRVQLGRAPLKLAPAQSEQLTQMVPPYLAASRNQDAQRADRIALGLIAGWKVEGAVTEGRFSSSAVPADSANELLALMLEHPGGRHQLLAKDASVLALGMNVSGGLLDAMVCTYAMVEQAEPSSDRLMRVLASLNAERQRRGLKPGQYVQLPTDFASQVAAAVRSGNAHPMTALRRLMEETSQVVRQPVHGYWVPAASLDDVHWSGELLTDPSMHVLITFAPYKESDMPWTTYAILIVTFEGNAASQT